MFSRTNRCVCAATRISEDLVNSVDSCSSLFSTSLRSRSLSRMTLRSISYSVLLWRLFCSFSSLSWASNLAISSSRCCRNSSIELSLPVSSFISDVSCSCIALYLPSSVLICLRHSSFS
uniref:Uncharacterized protein n=1 Tax=Anopheles atroparvus TaxID=41427 RepID=A0AAG5CZH5_ANOAO